MCCSSTAEAWNTMRDSLCYNQSPINQHHGWVWKRRGQQEVRRLMTRHEEKRERVQNRRDWCLTCSRDMTRVVRQLSVQIQTQSVCVLWHALVQTTGVWWGNSISSATQTAWRPSISQFAVIDHLVTGQVGNGQHGTVNRLRRSSHHHKMCVWVYIWGEGLSGQGSCAFSCPLFCPHLGSLWTFEHYTNRQQRQDYYFTNNPWANS